MNTVAAAADAIAQGGVIAYPTEAVYGLGCNPADQDAVLRLLRLKQRPVEKGLILIAADIKQFEPYIDTGALNNYPHVLSSWPGPHTWLLPCRETTPRWIRGEHDTIALRVTAHYLASELCRSFGGAIVSTSANISTQPPARSDIEVHQQFGASLNYILAGETDKLADVTPIRDARSGKVLR